MQMQDKNTDIIQVGNATVIILFPQNANLREEMPPCERFSRKEILAMSVSREASRERKSRDVFYTYSDMWSSVSGGSHGAPACASVGARGWGVCALRQRWPSHACPQGDLGPSSEMMIQKEVNDRVDAAVEKGQAAWDQQPVSLPRHPTAVSLCPRELRAGHDDFEDVVGEPGHHKGRDDIEDHLDGVPVAAAASRVCSRGAAFVEMHDDGAVAEHDDHDGQNKSEEHHEQGQAHKKIGTGFLQAERFISNTLHPSVHQVGNAEEQRAQPDRCTGGPDAPATPEEPGIHEPHHSQVAIHAHAGEEEDVREAVDGDDVAAQLAEQISSRTKVPVAIPAGRGGPQRQRDNKDEVGQSQIDHKRIHQATSFVSHHYDYKKIAKNSTDKDDGIHYRQEDVGALEVKAGTVHSDIPLKGCIISDVVVVIVIISVCLHGERSQRWSAVSLLVPQQVW